ncbi:hypothetical protein [Paracoccus versutus]|uniref:Uncharacterized protein n=1 Tax=Paracoccus versutus TaxID=34007 RepID=A0A3D9XZF1_PARVE|nr:hypothetical protein [Paracoccus versutus]REF72319.1 hypothetical protein BDD41_0788 [Paracoccus versutus]WGR55699.1 hypothetical protein E3U25_06905 [Paracoccus versutus]
MNNTLQENRPWVVSADTIRSVIQSHGGNRVLLEIAMLDFVAKADPRSVVLGLVDYILASREQRPGDVS